MSQPQVFLTFLALTPTRTPVVNIFQVKALVVAAQQQQPQACLQPLQLQPQPQLQPLRHPKKRRHYLTYPSNFLESVHCPRIAPSLGFNDPSLGKPSPALSNVQVLAFAEAKDPLVKVLLTLEGNLILFFIIMFACLQVHK